MIREWTAMRECAVLVRVIRLTKGLTAQQLAERTGGKLSRQAISKIETGGRRIDVNDLLVLAVALDVPVNQLLRTGDYLGDVAWARNECARALRAIIVCAENALKSGESND